MKETVPKEKGLQNLRELQDVTSLNLLIFTQHLICEDQHFLFLQGLIFLLKLLAVRKNMLWKICCAFNNKGHGGYSKECTSKKQMQILILQVVFPSQYSPSLPICFQIVLLWLYMWIYFMNHIFFRFLYFVSNLTYTFYVFIPLCNLQFAFYQSILQPVSQKVTATRDLVNLIGALYI